MELGTLSVFHLTPDLDPLGEAACLPLLAAALATGGVRSAVGVLGPAAGPVAGRLRAAGVPVHSLPVRYPFDVAGGRRLRRAVGAAAPSVVHAWGPRAVRASRLVATPARHGGSRPRLVVSGAADGPGGLAGWLTARQLRNADRVVAGSRGEGERYRRLGASGNHLTLIAPAVAAPGPPPDGEAFRRSLDIPPGARLVFAAGRFDADPGLKDAAWTFDIQRHDTPDLYLVLVGGGPGRGRVERFCRALAFDDLRVRFAGDRDDLPELLRLAAAVWVTHECCGPALALAGLAAGVPVLGWRTPRLADVIDDGETGFLVGRGDSVELAARTRAVLDDPGLAGRVTEAGKKRAEERFGPARMAAQFRRLYAELAG